MQQVLHFTKEFVNIFGKMQHLLHIYQTLKAATLSMGRLLL